MGIDSTEKQAGVYIIRCIPTGKVYVGSSCNIPNRWKQHRQRLKNKSHHSFKLQRAWDKYGENAFELEVVEEVVDGLLTVVEQAYINRYDSFNAGFNCTDLAGLSPGRPATGKAPQCQMALPNELYDALEQLGRANGILNPRNGHGNRTRVIERLFAQLPVFSKAKIAIQMLLDKHPQAKEYAEVVLIELEDLEIEQAYEEAKMEGNLPEPEPGAWIV